MMPKQPQRKRLFQVLLVLFVAISMSRLISAQQVVISQPIAVNQTGNSINQLEWSPDGQILAAASDDGVQFYDQSLELVGNIYQGTLVRSLSWNPDGTQLVLTNGLTLEIWDRNVEAESFSFNMSLQGENTQIGVFWSPDGSRIAAIEAFDVYGEWLGSFAIWNTSSWQLERRIGELYGFEMDFSISHRLDWAPDGTPLFAFAGYKHRLEGNTYFVDADSAIYIINAEDGAIEHAIPTIAGGAPTAVSWQPAGGFLAIGSSFGGVGIYSITSGDYVRPLGHSFPVGSVEWSPTGRYLAGDSSVSDISTGQFLAYFQADTGISTLAWHPNGTLLAIADIDGVLKIENALLLPNFTSEPTLTPIPTATR